MSSQSTKNAETENFISEWEKQEILWNVCSDKYKDRNEKQKNINRLMRMFSVTGMLF